MRRLLKPVLFTCLLCAAVLLNGCIDKTLYPSSELVVIAVEPYILTPASTDLTSLPSTSVTVNIANKVPCRLKSFSVQYFTPSGEPLPQLAINKQSQERIININQDNLSEVSEEADTSQLGQAAFTVYPYSVDLFNLFELSTSNISPVKARITLHFLDVNGNWIDLDAHCFLKKFEQSESTEETAANRRAR